MLLEQPTAEKFDIYRNEHHKSLFFQSISGETAPKKEKNRKLERLGGV
jgi:hypothetical protein